MRFRVINSKNGNYRDYNTKVQFDMQDNKMVETILKALSKSYNENYDTIKILGE